MKKILLALCASTILTASVATFAVDTSVSTTPSTYGTSGKNTPAEMQTISNDLSWLTTVNQNEIAAGKLAKSKSTNPAVKKFASMMINAHNKNLKKSVKLSRQLNVKLMETSDVKSLKEDGKKQLDDLKALKGSDFDKAYVRDMVNDHSDVLSKLNGMVNNAKIKQLQDHLMATREEVKNHLKMAKDLQANSNM